MRRTAVGIIALVLLGIAGYGYLRYGLDSGESGFFWSSCWRMGLVLGAIWFALPNLLEMKGKQSPMMLLIGLGLVMIIAVRPKVIVFLWPFLLILAVMQFFTWLIKPPPGKSRRKRRGNSHGQRVKQGSSAASGNGTEP